MHWRMRMNVCDTPKANVVGEEGRFLANAHVVCYGVILPCMLTASLIGNLLLIAVYLSKRERSQHFSICIVSRATTDIAVLTVALLMFSHQQHLLAFPGAIPILFGSMQTLHTASIWLTSLLAVDRCIAVKYPLRRQNPNSWLSFTRRRMHLTVASVIIGASIFNLLRFFELQVISCLYDSDKRLPKGAEVRPTKLRVNDKYSKIYLSGFHIWMVYIVPFSVIAILNTIIYRELQNARTKRRLLQEQVPAGLSYPDKTTLVGLSQPRCTNTGEISISSNCIPDMTELREDPVNAPHYQHPPLFPHHSSNLPSQKGSSVTSLAYVKEKHRLTIAKQRAWARRERSTTIMLAVETSAFLICNVLPISMNIMEAYFKQHLADYARQHAHILVVQWVGTILGLSKSSLTFYIYCISGSTFRRSVRAFILQKTHCLLPKSYKCRSRQPSRDLAGLTAGLTTYYEREIMFNRCYSRDEQGLAGSALNLNLDLLTNSSPELHKLRKTAGLPKLSGVTGLKGKSAAHTEPVKRKICTTSAAAIVITPVASVKGSGTRSK